jgi:hypothetical protein
MSKKQYVTAYGFLKSSGVSHFTMGEENSEKLRNFLLEKAKGEGDLIFNEKESEQPFAVGSLTGLSSLLNKPFNMEAIGDFHASNGAYQGTRFACEEYKKDAIEEHKRLSGQQKEREDFYHNNYRGS